MKEDLKESGRGLSYTHMIIYGVVIELILVAIQFLYVRISGEVDDTSKFTNEYMRNTGFLIFQVIGFFVYVFATYFLTKRIQQNLISKLILFLLAGAIVELAFYLFMQADYAGAFLYSILDKFVAGFFGWIIYKFADRGHRVGKDY
ncbi:hypothetical protein [uncultured Pontibacter sp.]|uniref:hypothetical protein n=1 Tax=uncultured Pontibacter sp. TaxID=453356 RepID=UPI002627C4F4|nr:hypothetical protein [uncultured Pontibacter sp.]